MAFKDSCPIARSFRKDTEQDCDERCNLPDFGDECFFEQKDEEKTLPLSLYNHPNKFIKINLDEYFHEKAID